MATAVLARIPDRWFEISGICVGFIGWASIASQIVKELNTPGPSSLAVLNIVGFLIIFSFWLVYGLRFRRFAVWFPNVVAILLQATLLVILLGKG